MNDNKEMITKLVKGELTNEEAMNLYEKLESRTEKQIIEDLVQLPFKQLFDTEECLENYLENEKDIEENKSTIESTKIALERLEIAVSEKIDKLIKDERKLSIDMLAYAIKRNYIVLPD